MMCIERSLYSLKKKVLEEIILNYAKEYSNKKIRLSKKNKPDLIDIIIRNNIEVDCRKYMPNIVLSGNYNHNISTDIDIEMQFAALENRSTM
jgi:hypothetical protein